MQPESAFVEVNGLRLHYLTWRGDDTSRGPIVLNHATGFLARLWQPIAERLAEAGFEVCAYDARGHGDSDKPEATERNYHWQNLADDLRAFLADRGLAGVPFVGHSSGAAAGLFVEGHHPGTFSRIAVFEPIVMPGGFHPDEKRRSEMSAGARKRRMVFESPEALIEQYRQRPTFKLWRDDLLRLYAEEGAFRLEDGTIELKCPGAIEGKIFANSGSLDIWSVLRDITVPALVMRGEGTEGFLNMVCEGVTGRMPNARLVTIPDAGHLAPMERPDAVADELLAFLDGA